MKACPQCYRIYPEADGFCPVDGGKLSPYAEVTAQPGTDDRHLGKTVAGRYEMRRIVADGGMGRVYEARDAQADRRVAIKILHPEVARDAVAVERFKREFEISHELPHDHIVEVFDFQEPAHREFVMAMEFLDGEELRAVLKREKILEPARMVRMLSQIAMGLDEAHRREFVHRDLKPDNIFLCGSHDGDVVKLLDFGSVRINKNRKVKQLTSLGTTIGSPFYMSPEQAQGAEDLDHRADVFALGAIAYECLTGAVPFSGANGPAILLAILTKNPPPISTKAKVPAALDDVIDDALAKRPETRTGSVGALADAFGKAFGLQGTHLEWAKTSVAELKHNIEQGASTAVADPFAAPRPEPPVVADPFAVPLVPPRAAPPAPIATQIAVAPALGVAPAAPLPPAPSSTTRAAAMAMDDAFATAGMEPAGVPGKSSMVVWAVIVGVVLVIAIVLVIALK